ncbi:MAG: PBP1A family penicillin-binding protein [Turicibacter sp.]|jgi:1A family penicillin-binding protein|uniref:Penicillin-binding protein n=1 Tax=Turicibacter faecis TaxID=2963365 RepID=A0ABM8IQD4_9FIRM|nr:MULTISPECIES: PBP1A family penicillin-binding protein [unclassified Turicibacter]MCI8701924.1 PBP1A family penicillin-binding protein [Turicibacter sp.]BEH91769.1 penicillin-binding protein [Turicibacter sp. TC023]MCU7205561.1 PBP1A family penicillin-binding protein [Turicibacter sp. TA25]MCU7210186.1 PBP1A family penicillin-binding protein [Turicibacter sp. 1E2]NCE79392.1 PBP1A family penicillin-binding protein [Turicibacter sp. TS3]
MKLSKKISAFFKSKYTQVTAVICLELIAIMCLTVYQYFKYLPAPDINVNTTITFYDSKGEVFLEKTYPKDQHWVSLDEISPYVINGFIATEDRNFYDHFGFDPLRMAKAVITNLTTGTRAQGASTITQQYARNLYLSFEKTWSRKIKEAFYTIRLELGYDKDTILEGYLNTINFGHGNYGIEDASLYYFGKHANELSLAEASILVGIPKGPTYYSPIKNPENSSNRQKIVLKSMLDENYISVEDYEHALKSDPVVIGEIPGDVDYEAPYYVDAVLAEVDHLLDGQTSSYRNLNIYTTLDQEIQSQVNKSIVQNVKDLDVQTAVIVMEPSTGYVKALSGGNNYEESQYNRALYSERQIGSLMKPFLYYAALEYGFNPSTTFMNEPTTFTYNGGKDSYTPNNYNSSYAYKSIPMANALAVSDNIYAVKTHTFLGLDVLPKTTKRFGISANIPSIPSAALGVEPVNIMEMAEAYSIFANNGKSVNRKFITSITDDRGFLVYSDTKTEQKQILDKTKTYIMNEMMTGMFNLQQNNHLSITGLSIIQNLTHQYAGKSGSTNTDSWMIGYTPELLTTVWTGYDQGRTLDGVEVNHYAKNIWSEVMENSLKNTQTEWFEKPKNVVAVKIDPTTGYLASEECKNKVTLYYEKNNVPSISCEDHYHKSSLTVSQ